MYEVGNAMQVRAFHVMPGIEGPEGERHSHDYRIEVVVERSELDERGMVCDLDALDQALLKTVERVRDADLDVVCAGGATDAVTVEVFARWAHGELTEPAREAGGEILGVRVWESPDAFGGYRARIV